MAEKEYIERESLLENLHKFAPEHNTPLIQLLVTRQPTADVAEVKHGELEHIADFGKGNCFGYCSVCRAEHKADNPTALKFAYRYCSWCGAKMDGKEKDNAK